MIFRADGDSKMGLGHIYRSLAFVEMVSHRYDCIFFTRNFNRETTNTIKEICQCVTLPIEYSYLDEIDEISKYIDNKSIVVLDGYQFDSLYQAKIKSLVTRLISIDDKAEGLFYSDLIINNGNSEIANLYRKDEKAKLLMGLPYVLLRKEFISVAKKERTIKKTDTLFICMGGADPFNVTNKVLRASLKCGFIKKIIIVTGNAFSFLAELRDLIHTDVKIIEHKSNVNAETMVQLILKSDIAITTASSIALEICSVKAGLLICTVIDNQKAIYAELIEKKCAIGIGDLLTMPEDTLVREIEKLSDLKIANEIIKNQIKNIDGYSGDRIISEIKKMIA